MKGQQDKKAQQIGRKAFLRQKKAQGSSKTDQVLAAADGSASVMQIRNRVGGRARKVRRG